MKFRVQSIEYLWQRGVTRGHFGFVCFTRLPHQPNFCRMETAPQREYSAATTGSKTGQIWKWKPVSEDASLGCSAPLCDLLRPFGAAPRWSRNLSRQALWHHHASDQRIGTSREARAFRDEYLPGFAGCATPFPRRNVDLFGMWSTTTGAAASAGFRHNNFT